MGLWHRPWASQPEPIGSPDRCSVHGQPRNGRSRIAAPVWGGNGGFCEVAEGKAAATAPPLLSPSPAGRCRLPGLVNLGCWGAAGVSPTPPGRRRPRRCSARLKNEEEKNEELASCSPKRPPPPLLPLRGAAAAPLPPPASRPRPPRPQTFWAVISRSQAPACSEPLIPRRTGFVTKALTKPYLQPRRCSAGCWQGAEPPILGTGQSWGGVWGGLSPFVPA